MEALPICRYSFHARIFPHNNIYSNVNISNAKKSPQTTFTTVVQSAKPLIMPPPPPKKLFHGRRKYSVSAPPMKIINDFPERMFKSIDRFITNFMDLPLHPSIDPTKVLAGNFAPVAELPPTPCEIVEGYLPSCLDGAYIRVGPNPQFIPRGPYHLLDGDGMLHSIRISGGGATFCRRYVKTYKYELENKMGYPIFPSVFSSFNGFSASAARLLLAAARVFAGQLNPIANGFGLANTSLSFFCGGLYALCESDFPYAVKLTPDGDLVTIGRQIFHGEPFASMTAHPKVDPTTGEVFAFRYNILRPPFMTVFRISPDGRKQKEVPIFSLNSASFVHDFAVTQNYAVFPDTQIVMDPMEILRGKSPVGTDPRKTPRIGVMPRYVDDESEMTWIDVPGLNILHVVNAWEEDNGDTIVMVASNTLTVEHAMDQMGTRQLSLEKITIAAKAKKVVARCPVSDKNLDMGVINPHYAQNKNRYIYATVTDQLPKAAGVVKIDLSISWSGTDANSIVASRLYGPGCYGGEPYFVANNNLAAAEEDDGYLVTYMHDENTDESWFLVMNAKSPNLEIVAKVRMPGRVPYGFHGLFVSENNL
ncbi:hypothetical protein ABFX02_04G163500 [Erythranthe guttata]